MSVAECPHLPCTKIRTQKSSGHEWLWCSCSIQNLSKHCARRAGCSRGGARCKDWCRNISPPNAFLTKPVSYDTSEDDRANIMRLYRRNTRKRDKDGEWRHGAVLRSISASAVDFPSKCPKFSGAAGSVATSSPENRNYDSIVSGFAPSETHATFVVSDDDVTIADNRNDSAPMSTNTVRSKRPVGIKKENSSQYVASVTKKR